MMVAGVIGQLIGLLWLLTNHVRQPFRLLHGNWAVVVITMQMEKRCSFIAVDQPRWTFLMERHERQLIAYIKQEDSCNNTITSNVHVLLIYNNCQVQICLIFVRSFEHGVIIQYMHKVISIISYHINITLRRKASIQN